MAKKLAGRLCAALACVSLLAPFSAARWPRQEGRGGEGVFVRALRGLDLSGEQRAKVRAILRNFREGGGGAGVGAAERVRKMRADVSAVLTPEQRERLRRELESAGGPRPDGGPAKGGREAGGPSPAVGAPEELERYRQAAAYSASEAGLSLLVMKNGEVVFEQYEDGFDTDTPHQLASGTKSFWGVAAAAAADDGILRLDELAADTVTEWKSDPRRSKITVRHLLNFTSGLSPAERLFSKPEVRDRYAYAVGSAAAHAPGSIYQYDDVHLYAFGELLRRKLAARAAGGRAEDPLAYLQRRVLDPLSLRVSRWARDEAGNPAMPYGAVLTAREWAKFGELVRSGGVWKGRRLVSEARLAECFAGSRANPAYGLTFWLNAAPGPRSAGVEAADAGAPRAVGLRGDVGRVTRGGIYAPERLRGLVMAAGAGQQRLYVIPSRGLVVVRQANRNLARAVLGGGRMKRGFRDDEFLARLLDGVSGVKGGG